MKPVKRKMLGNMGLNPSIATSLRKQFWQAMPITLWWSLALRLWMMQFVDTSEIRMAKGLDTRVIQKEKKLNKL